MKLKDIKPRLYQESIFAKATLYNTLVILPTGLGKTTIAIMLAAYRLKQYPNSKVIMLAPTKPLCEQHFNSFNKHLEIDPNHIALILGSMPPSKRKELWNKKVIIATPQTLKNDAAKDPEILSNVSLLIFDEAHRAQGNYSYVPLAKLYMETSKYPRILALTASPGSDLEKIREVIKNLFIEHLEIKDENDPDVKPYVHTTETEIIDVELTEEFKRIKSYLESALKKRTEHLQEMGYFSKSRVTKKELIEAQNKIFSEEDNPSKYTVVALISEALKIYHALELLESQGLKPLDEYFSSLEEQAGIKKSLNLRRLMKDLDLRNAMVLTKQLIEKGVVHPKVIKLKELIKEILSSNESSKIIIFTQFRDTAFDIENFLKEEGISCAVFIGQQKKKGKGYSQKKQKEILDKFREGHFQVLISTSIGEEGLDIPQVDYVIFYEPVPSVIRFIQRKGRTGRHREGKVYILHTKGTVDSSYRWAVHHKYKRLKKALLKLKKELEEKRVMKDSKKDDTEIVTKKEPILSLHHFLKKKEEENQHNEQNSVKDVLQNPDSVKEIVEIKRKSKEPIIFVDFRELKSPVVEQLKSLGAEVIFKNLDVGDFLLSDRLVIEFKTREDFINSLVDGRLFNQAQKLRNYEKPLIIVQGEEDLYTIRMIHPNAIRGAISSLIIDYNIPILFTSNPKETANYLYIMARREQFVEKKNIFILHANKPKTLREAQLYLISSIPNIGPVLGENLLKHFKTIKNIANASIFDLKKIPLLGEKKAKIIFDIFNKTYEEDQDK